VTRVMTIRQCLLIGVLTHLFGTSIAWAGSGKVNGLYYETKGAGEAVVFIHGGQMDRRMWDEQYDLFAKHYRVIRYDIRGFGKSDAPEKPYSDADDLRSLLDHVRVKKATLIGLSLGAAVATDFAILFPDAVNSLVLACPGLGGFRFEDKANDLRAVVEAVQDENHEMAAELWLKNPYMSVAMENPALRTKLTQLARENTRCWLNNPLMKRQMKPPAAERLPQISIPSLVVGGERDVSDIQKIVARLASEIPGAERQIVPGAGHLVPMENPDAFNRIALEFLAKVYRK